MSDYYKLFKSKTNKPRYKLFGVVLVVVIVVVWWGIVFNMFYYTIR